MVSSAVIVNLLGSHQHSLPPSWEDKLASHSHPRPPIITFMSPTNLNPRSYIKHKLQWPSAPYNIDVLVTGVLLDFFLNQMIKYDQVERGLYPSWPSRMYYFFRSPFLTLPHIPIFEVFHFLWPQALWKYIVAFPQCSYSGSWTTWRIEWRLNNLDLP